MRKREIATKSFEEIKYNFENRSYFIRSEFMNTLNAKDNAYLIYYVYFINKNVVRIKNQSYLSDLICFTIDLNIFQDEIIRIWYCLLQNNTNTIVLLSLLDYFNLCSLKKLPKDYERILFKLFKERKKIIIKNQVLINLLLINEFNEEYKELLLCSLKKTKDYKSILRVISTFQNFNSPKIIGEIKKLIKNIDLEYFGEDMKCYILDRVGRW